MYTRLPGGNLYIQKIIYTAAVQEPNWLYTQLPGVSIKCYSHGSRSRAKSAIYTAAVCPHKIVVYTAAIQELNLLYTLLPREYIKLLFTRQPSKVKICFMQCLWVSTKTCYLHGSHPRAKSTI